MTKLTILISDALAERLPAEHGKPSELVRRLLAEWAGDASLAEVPKRGNRTNHAKKGEKSCAFHPGNSGMESTSS